MNEQDDIKLAGFGGGCHWCTEAVFASLKGVTQVQQGWIASEHPYDSFSEAVLVKYNSSVISFKELISVHITTHASASFHSMRHKYRSAVYCFNETDLHIAEDILYKLYTTSNNQLITIALPFVSFKLNTEQYLDYYYSDRQRPFCKVYIQPKIDLLKDDYKKLLKDNI